MERNSGLVWSSSGGSWWLDKCPQTNHVTESISAVPPLGPICPKQITTDYVRLALLGGNDPEEVLSTSIHVIFCSLLNKELTLSQQITPSLYRFSPEPITYFVDIQEDILKRKWWRLWKRTRQLANNTVAKNSWIVAETRAIIPASEIFLEHASSPLQETAIILLLEAITISWSWSRFVSYRRRNIGPFQKRLKVAEMIQPTLTMMTWALNKATNVLKANRDISGAINWRLCGRLESGVQLDWLRYKSNTIKWWRRKAHNKLSTGLGPSTCLRHPTPPF